MVLGPLLELRRNVERLHGSAECKLVARMENTRRPCICSCAYVGANGLSALMLSLRSPRYNNHCVFTQPWSKTDVRNYVSGRGFKGKKDAQVRVLSGIYRSNNFSGLVVFQVRIPRSTALLSLRHSIYRFFLNMHD